MTPSQADGASAPPIVVALPETLPPSFLDAVAAVSPRLRIVRIPIAGPLPPEVAAAEVFYRSYALRPEIVDAVIARAVHLRWMHVPAAGIELALTPRVLQANFTITNVTGIYDVPVAEHGLALILAAAKRLPEYFRGQQERRWLRTTTWDDVGREPVLPMLLGGKTAAVIGFGRIGGTLAGFLKAIGMHVLGIRREPRPDPRADAMYGPDQLTSVIREADFVVLTLPLTPATEHMIGAEQIACMKPTAWLVNLGRGGVVDDAALIDALTQRRIAGACLDVFSAEPLPPESPYYGLPNVILTPHVAGAFPELNEMDREYFIMNLRRYLAGEPLVSVVDRTRGY